jgi:hypothetical protein
MLRLIGGILTTSLLVAALAVGRAAPTWAEPLSVRVIRSGSTWFDGTDSRGERVTVVFLKRFATVARDGGRVPISYLKSGDRVECNGRVRGHRILAGSARLVSSEQPRAGQRVSDRLQSKSG